MCNAVGVPFRRPFEGLSRSRQGRQGLMLRCTGGRSAEVYHVSWYTSRSQCWPAQTAGQATAAEGVCTTCPSGRGTPYCLGRSAFSAGVPRVPPDSERLHMCAKDASDRKPASKSSYPHARISSLYLVVQVVQGVYKARLTRANACTTCKSPCGTPRLEKS
jgi:hypothetical protein